ncbi:MAG: CRTAC1 family protein [Methanomassiliicoccales archaeon]|nr:MAG: CRTAC1 family protein [Methanomassiliicoccales archaeon]
MWDMNHVSTVRWASCCVAALLFISFLSFGTVEPDEPVTTVMAPPIQPSADEPVTFTNVSEQVGLAGVTGRRYSWADYDNDGDQDLLIGGGKLFRNNGAPNWDFTEVTSQAGLYGKVSGGVWADYDNDGWLDFYATAGLGREDILWHNEGDGTFENVTYGAGNVLDGLPSESAGWGDYDNDGYVDLYVANYEWTIPNPWQSFGTMDILWHNNGDGTFTNVTVSAGIDDYSNPHQGRGVAWGDYDNDGDLDIYISNYRLRPNFLWENNGDGTFTERAFDRGVAGIPRWYGGYTYYGHTIGSAWGDIDNDGDLDLFAANLVHKDVFPDGIRGYICDDSKLYQNNGSAENFDFWDIRESAGIPIIPPGEKMYDPASGFIYYRDELYSSPSFGDYDNDGDLDLFVTQVYYLVHGDSHLFRNNGNSTFTNVTEEAGVKVWNSWGTSWADYDNDGDLDLIVEGSSYPDSFYEVRLYRNNGSPNNWLKIDLRGCWSNWAAIGARVTVTNGTVTQMREVEGGTGTGSSQNSLTVEFGFDDYSGTVDIQIRWPSGLIQDVTGVTLNQTLEITEISCLAAPTGVSAELFGTMDQDVRVTWTASPDEGSGYFGNYAVYRGTTYNKYGSGYVFIGSALAGTTELIDSGNGHGEPNTHFYYVQVNSTTGFGAKSKAQAAKYTKYLEIGINLISSPVLSSDSSLSSVLKTLNWDKAWSYNSWDTSDPWKMNALGKPVNDFVTVAPSTGIWVNVLTSDYFTVAGGVPENVQISLSTGWNLVGYPSFRSDYYIADLIADTQCVEIEGYFLPAVPYYLTKLLPTDLMMTGGAYWVRVPADVTWTVEN